MRRRLGFTLVELLVVIAIITLLVAILAPSLNRARELTKRVMCRQNLNSLGKGYAMYQSANNDSWPYHAAKNDDWTSKTGQSGMMSIRTKAFWNIMKQSPAGNYAYCITSLAFMLVRDGQNAGLFLCPSDPDDSALEPNAKDPNGNYYWDFSNFKMISYSVQGAPPPGRAFSIARQFILADKNPNWDGSRTTGPLALVAWSDTITEAQRKNNMSRNHQQEEINTLRGDGTAAVYPRADIGDLTPRDVTPKITNDCIYTAYGGSPGNARSAISTDPAQHDYLEDAFLFGPK